MARQEICGIYLCFLPLLIQDLLVKFTSFPYVEKSNSCPRLPIMHTKSETTFSFYREEIPCNPKEAGLPPLHYLPLKFKECFLKVLPSKVLSDLCVPLIALQGP